MNEVVNASRVSGGNLTNNDGRAGVAQHSLAVVEQTRRASWISRSKPRGSFQDVAHVGAGLSAPLDFGTAGW